MRSKPSQIILKTPTQIAAMREWWKYLTELLSILKSTTKIGMTLMEIEQKALEYLSQHWLQSAFYLYQWYPAATCLSLNHCLVHGVPDHTVLRPGDLLKIDMGIKYQGMVTDAAISMIVGGEPHNFAGAQLIEATKNALDEWLKVVGAGAKMSHFGQIVNHTIKSAGFTVVKTLTGHGVGTSLHEYPHITNYPDKKTSHLTFKSGMTIALEPITSIRSDDYITQQWNRRNLYTKYGDLGAQREYTLVVTDQGYEILAGVV